MGTQRRMDSDEGPETPESCRSCAIADITREFISTTRAINPPGARTSSGGPRHHWWAATAATTV